MKRDSPGMCSLPPAKSVFDESFAPQIGHGYLTDMTPNAFFETRTLGSAICRPKNSGHVLWKSTFFSQT